MNIFKLIFGGVSELIGGYFETKKQKQEAETQKYIADLNATSDYDLQAQKNMQHSWKDEYLILLHTFPIWGYIIPSEELTVRLDILWNKFDSAPDWWWWIYLGIIVSTFGLRFMFKGLSNIKSISNNNNN
jgi:hypothetical protein